MKKPSITELIKLLDKPALLNWANKQGLKGIDISLSKSKQEGASIHRQIERYIKDSTPFDDMNNQIMFDKLFSDKEITHNEYNIETDYFTGRIDLCYIKDGMVYLSDFKLNRDRVYFEDYLQLSAYSMAIDCNRFSIISVPNFKEIPVTINDIEKYINIIKSLSDIYKNKQLLNI
jgi:hypothetical protein